MISHNNLRRLLIGVASVGGALVFMPLATELVIRQADTLNFFSLAPQWLAQAFDQFLLLINGRIFSSVTIFVLGTVFGLWLASYRSFRSSSASDVDIAELPQVAAQQSVARPPAVKTSEYTPAALRENMRRSDRTDFDLSVEKLTITIVRHDHGFDVSAVLRYVNRSDTPLYIKPLSVEFEVDGRRPEGNPSDGFSNPMPKSRGANVRLNPVHIFDERPISGSVQLDMKFGQTTPVRCGVTARHQFHIADFPNEKAVPRIYVVDAPTSLQYFVQSE